jgi:hypothetical protein
MTTDRDVGLDFGDLDDDLESESFPLSKDELLDRYGDREIGLESGTRTLDELLGPVGKETFDGQDDVHQTVLTMVDEAAEGRTEYSDRGTSTENTDDVSL